MRLKEQQKQEERRIQSLKQKIGNSRRKIEWYRSIHGANKTKIMMILLKKGNHQIIPGAYEQSIQTESSESSS